MLSNRSAGATGFNFQVHPTPVRTPATVAYTVPSGPQTVLLAVYNSLGQQVHALASARQTGPRQVALGGLPAGQYLVRLQIGGQATSRLVVME